MVYCELGIPDLGRLTKPPLPIWDPVKLSQLCGRVTLSVKVRGREVDSVNHRKDIQFRTYSL